MEIGPTTHVLDPFNNMPLRHHFGEGCQTLDWIVRNIFKAAALMDDHEEAKQRAGNPNLTFLVVHLLPDMLAGINNAQKSIY